MDDKNAIHDYFLGWSVSIDGVKTTDLNRTEARIMVQDAAAEKMAIKVWWHYTEVSYFSHPLSSGQRIYSLLGPNKRPVPVDQEFVYNGLL